MKLFTILLSILISTAAVADRHGNSTTGAEHGMSGDNPFILIARVQVKKGMVEEYLRIAEAVDNAVEKTEPGMLFHNFDADPDDPLAFNWTELYANSDAFLLHTSNAPVLEYVGQHAQLGEGFTLEIYGNVTAAVIENIADLGFPLKHFKTTRVGYVRPSITN
jgi:quinol monooxygenase YgiN